MMDGVTSIETPDDKTVVVTLSAPNSEFLGIMNAPYTGVINSDVAIEQGANADEDADASDTAEPWFLEHSAGTGPFVLATYRPNDELRLTRNESYWGDKPAFAEVVIRQTKDAVSQAQMLEIGDADIAMQIDPDTAEVDRARRGHRRVGALVQLRLRRPQPGRQGQPVPLTPQVREAIGYAIDYQGVIDFTLGGEGKLQASPIPNGFPGTEGLPMPVQDVDKAKALLAEAGVGDGFTIDAIYPSVNAYGVDFTPMMQKVQQDLAKVGIEAEPAAGRLLGLARPRQRRRHSADGGLLCARLLRLRPVRAVFRDDRRHRLVQAGGRRERPVGRQQPRGASF